MTGRADDPLQRRQPAQRLLLAQLDHRLSGHLTAFEQPIRARDDLLARVHHRGVRRLALLLDVAPLRFSLRISARSGLDLVTPRRTALVVVHRPTSTPKIPEPLNASIISLLPPPITSSRLLELPCEALRSYARAEGTEMAKLRHRDLLDRELGVPPRVCRPPAIQR